MTHLGARTLHEPRPGSTYGSLSYLRWPQVTSEEPGLTRHGPVCPAEAGLELQQVTTTQQLPPDPGPGPIISDQWGAVIKYYV